MTKKAMLLYCIIIQSLFIIVFSGASSAAFPPGPYPAVVMDASVSCPSHVNRVLIGDGLYSPKGAALATSSCADHGTAMRDNIIMQAQAGLPKSRIPVVYTLDPFYGFSFAGGMGGEKIISQSTTGLTWDHNRAAADVFRRRSIGFVHAARPDVPELVTLGPMVVSTVRDAQNLTALGNEEDKTIEFLGHYVSCKESNTNSPSCQNDSGATSHVAGALLHLLLRHGEWNFFDARAALRKAAYDHPLLSARFPEIPPRRWSAHQGYGVIDTVGEIQDTVGLASVLSLKDLDMQPPVGIKIIANEIHSRIELHWHEFRQSKYSHTLVVRFDDPPSYDTPPGAGEILYSGSSELGYDSMAYYPEKNGVYYFGFYSAGKDGSTSPLEEYAIRAVPFAMNASKRSASALYVDNESRNTVQDGLSWATALTTLTAANNAAHHGDRIFVKATNTLYRETFRPGKKVTWFFDATGKGMERGKKQAHLSRSRSIPASAWTASSLGKGVYRHTLPMTPPALEKGGWSDLTLFAWSGDAIDDRAYFRKTSKLVPAPGEYSIQGNVLAINSGEESDPAKTFPRGFELTWDDYAIASDGMPVEVHGGVFEHGRYGIYGRPLNAFGGETTRFTGTTFRYNVEANIMINQESMNIGKGVIRYAFHGSTIYGAARNGVSVRKWTGAAPKTSIETTLSYCVIRSNGGRGVYAESGSPVGDMDITIKVGVVNSILYANKGVGIHFHTPSNTKGEFISKNNIAMGNDRFGSGLNYHATLTQHDFARLDAGFNCSGDGMDGFSPQWREYGGKGNLGVNPLWKNPEHADFALLPSSPCINKGDDAVWSGVSHVRDFPGNSVTDSRGSVRSETGGVDMGAYEFMDNQPPVVTLLGENPLRVMKGMPFHDPGATAWDAADGDVGSTLLIGGDRVDSSRAGWYLVTYKAHDSSGKSSAETVRTVIVERDFSGGNGRLLRVPEDYESIGDAVEAARSGDVVAVGDGIYRGRKNKNISFAGKALALVAVNGPRRTVIDLEGSGNAFLFKSGEAGDSILYGFGVMRGGSGSKSIVIYNASPRIENCYFSHNMDSPLLIQKGARPLIARCVFFRNDGGWRGGAVEIQNARPFITNSIFTHNNARYGGAIFCMDSAEPLISHCTFFGNTASIGGGIFDYSGKGLIIHSILWNNAPWDIAGHGSSPLRLEHAIVEEGYGYDGIAILKEDPLFVDAANQDFRPRKESPAIDQAALQAPGAWFSDFQRRERVTGAAADLGAHEFSADNGR